jgi:uncharacterized membrane protein YcaP (DUF421 family)
MNDILDVLIRTLVAYFALLVLTRIAGRKQMAHLTFFDYITGITIGSIAGGMIFDLELELWLGVVAITAWFALLIFTDIVTLKLVPARKIFTSEPLLVILNGQILEENLGKKYYNINDLLMKLRSQGVFDPSQVAVGIVEENGKLSILKKAENEPLTPMSSMAPPPPHSPEALNMIGKEIIIDGKVMKENLRAANISEEWLEKQLKASGIDDYAQVAVAMLKPDGNLYIDLKKDIVPESQRQGYLW